MFQLFQTNLVIKILPILFQKAIYKDDFAVCWTVPCMTHFICETKDRNAEQEPKDLDAWIILKNVSILVTKSSIAFPPPPPNRLNIEMFHLL